MQTTAVMDEGNWAVRSPKAGPSIRVVIAYDDLAAGKHAMQVLSNIGQGLGDAIEFEPMPWAFGLLADVDWREVAANEAVKADILIIASSGSRPVPPAVARWTETALQRKQGTAAAVVALFGSVDNPDGGGSPRLEFIQQAAREAGLEFFAPVRRLELDEALAGIHRRSEMVTPLLGEILAQPSKPGPSRRERTP